MWNLTEPRPTSLEDMMDIASGFGKAIGGQLIINENPVPDEWTALSNEAGGLDILVNELTSIYEPAD